MCKKDCIQETTLYRRTAVNKDVSEIVPAVLKNSVVDSLVQSADLTELSREQTLKERSSELLLDRQEICRGPVQIKHAHHFIALRPDAKEPCEPMRRRSPKREEMEEQAMRKLKIWRYWRLQCQRGIQTMFLSEKDGSICVNSGSRRLSAIALTDSYPMENMIDNSELALRYAHIFGFRHYVWNISIGTSTRVKRMHRDTNSARPAAA